SVAMTAPFIFVGFLLSLLYSDKRKERFLSLIYATISTIVLSLSVILPMLEQTAYTELKVPTGRALNGLQVSVYFSKLLDNTIAYYGIGLVIGLLLVASFIVFSKFSNF